MTSPSDANDTADAEDMGPSVLDIFETDTSAEEDGRWFDILGDKGKGEIKLRGFASKGSMNARRVLDATYRRHLKPDGTYPVDIAQRLVDEQLAKGIIMDWRGPAWRDKDGPLKFTPATALSILQKAPHLRNRIAVLAGDMDAFRRQEKEDAVKN